MLKYRGLTKNMVNFSRAISGRVYLPGCLLHDGDGATYATFKHISVGTRVFRQSYSFPTDVYHLHDGEPLDTRVGSSPEVYLY